jgi:HSP20 family protein
MYLTTNPLNRMFNDLFKDLDWSAQDGVAASWVPPVDVREEVDTIRISAELPGVKPEDVKISVEGKVLTVQGTKQQEAEQRTERVHRYERPYGSFARTFALPATVDTEQIKAGFDNGVLTITLPKAAQAKPRQIAVEVAKQS